MTTLRAGSKREYKGQSALTGFLQLLHTDVFTLRCELIRARRGGSYTGRRKDQTLMLFEHQKLKYSKFLSASYAGGQTTYVLFLPFQTRDMTFAVFHSLYGGDVKGDASFIFHFFHATSLSQSTLYKLSRYNLI